MGKTGKPYLPDLEPFIAAGIDPKTNLPKKITDSDPVHYKDSIKRQLRIIDEQDAVNRYRWYNLPKGLNSNLIERILYYKGQGAFFYSRTMDTFYFLPYTLDGTIDCYGRFTGITPITFNGAKTAEGKDKAFIDGLVLEPVYDVILPDKLKLSDLTDKCVLLTDYSRQISQTVLPRQSLNDPLLDMMANCLPYMNTALMLGTGIKGIRVGDESEEPNVNAAAKSFQNAALTGQGYVPLTAALELQELAGGTVGSAEDYLMAMQSLDNYRLGTLGLSSGGIFQKKAHELQSQADINSGNSGLIMDDGLYQRQEACNLFNSIWGLGIWCEVNETELGTDRNMDGEVSGSEKEQYFNQIEQSAPDTYDEGGNE